MKITFLGTGTSQGVPVIACKCDVCCSNDSKDKRLRSSVLLEIENQTFVIDAGPDFRQQMLRENVQTLDAILITHEHKDHVGGLDDVRAFNYVMKKPSDIYAEKRVHESIKREYSYVFAELKYPGIPKMNLHEIKENPFQVNNIKIEPIRVFHNKLPILGFKIRNFAYITDANKIPDKEKLKNLDVLVINALRKKKHISHFCLKGALKLIKELKPKKAYLTHISHLMGEHKIIEKELPKNVFFAYDGLLLDCPISSGEIVKC